MNRKSIVAVVFATLSVAPVAFAAADATATAPAATPAAATPASAPDAAAATPKPTKKLEKTCNDMRVPDKNSSTPVSNDAVTPKIKC
jgi:hypothetical protein